MIPTCEIGEDLINYECVFSSTCPSGYYVDGDHCEEIPTCEINEELIDNECVDKNVCPEGYVSIPGGCQKENTGLPPVTIAVIATGGTVSLGAILYFLRKYFLRV